MPWSRLWVRAGSRRFSRAWKTPGTLRPPRRRRLAWRLLASVRATPGCARSPLSSMDELARFLKTVVLGHHLERLPESEREHFVAIVAARLAQRGELVVDYLRLNILAKREVTA